MATSHQKITSRSSSWVWEDVADGVARDYFYFTEFDLLFLRTCFDIYVAWMTCEPSKEWLNIPLPPSSYRDIQDQLSAANAAMLDPHDVHGVDGDDIAGIIPHGGSVSEDLPGLRFDDDEPDKLDEGFFKSVKQWAREVWRCTVEEAQRTTPEDSDEDLPSLTPSRHLSPVPCFSPT